MIPPERIDEKLVEARREIPTADRGSIAVEILR